MQFNPHRITRVERLAFQLSGDKVEQKLKHREVLTPAERESYFVSAVRKAMKEVAHAN